MRSFLRDVWQFIVNRRDHPIMRHELAGWSYMRIWRGLRRGCVPLMGLLVLGTSGLCGLFTLLSATGTTPAPEAYPLAVLVALFGMLMAGGFINWLSGLLATALTATTISAEVEAKTYGLLRLTTISAREIVLAKFGAAFRQFRAPLAMVIFTRLFFVLGIIALAVGFIIGQSAGALSAIPTPPPGNAPPAASIDPFQLPLSGVLTTGLGIAGVLLSLLIWLIYFLLQPILSLLLFASIGMLGSAWSKTRASGLLAAGGFRVAWGAVTYVASQLIGLTFSLLSIPIAAIPASTIWLERLSRTSPGLLVLGGTVLAIGWILMLLGMQWALINGFLYLASRRARKLPIPD